MKCPAEEIKEGHQHRFGQFHFTFPISFPVLHIYVALTLILDGPRSGLAHSREGISVVFGFYENEFPRHGGHGHSPSTNGYLCVLCVSCVYYIT